MPGTDPSYVKLCHIKGLIDEMSMHDAESADGLLVGRNTVVFSGLSCHGRRRKVGSRLITHKRGCATEFLSTFSGVIRSRTCGLGITSTSHSSSCHIRIVRLFTSPYYHYITPTCPLTELETTLNHRYKRYKQQTPACPRLACA